VADDHLHKDDSIKAPAKHPIDRIRNASVREWVTSWRANIDGSIEAGYATWEGARSIIII
jgi:hypothetical protein